jgi:hypothetical protein
VIVQLDPKGNPNVWNDTDKLKLTYCIAAKAQKYNYAQIQDIDYSCGKNAATNGVNCAKGLEKWEECRDGVIRGMAMTEATWENVANVEFKYVPSQDENATTANKNVKFVVRPATRNDIINYLLNNCFLPRALASSPGPGTLEVIIFEVNSTFGSLELSHELGHLLGLMHEMKDPGDKEKALTSYDENSIMWPFWRGQTTLSDLDAKGIIALYGDSLLRCTILIEPTVAKVSSEAPGGVDGALMITPTTMMSVFSVSINTARRA